jgi:aldehyde dehydrogenase (NAD+)
MAMTERKTLSIDVQQALKETFDSQRAHYMQMKNSSLKYRLNKLKEIKEEILGSQEEIEAALMADLNRPRMETDLVEILPVVSELNHIIKDLSGWMKDEKVSTPILHTGTKSWVRSEAKGVCLIIAPWNYPFQLMMYPLISAIAAGNTCILKPSEFSPETGKLIKKMVEKIFDRNEVALFEGQPGLSQEMLKFPFDHIFFTGSTAVGKHVMRAAAEHLSTVTLELGGKSPVIIDKNADIAEAAYKVAWGKFINSGQTCIAPDYLMIHNDVIPVFIKKYEESLQKMQKENNDQYTSIVNEKQYTRLKEVFDEAVSMGAKVELGGEFDDTRRRISPTILSKVPLESRLLQEEIFGPFLPIIPFEDKEQVVNHINGGGHPLAMYVFSRDMNWVDDLLNRTHSGGVAINDVLLHIANHNLPFGGVGASGQGQYHGKYGFDEFSHKRAVLKRTRDMGAQYFYPPYTEKKKGMVEAIFNKLSKFL